ncbi:MAG: ECF-type sigma factor [Gemmatimonadota bacterium]|nr:ECF-type sigma factor [Gemmatimonadota bacterium]
MTQPDANRSMQPIGEITRLLGLASRGNAQAFNDLVPFVYDELHAIAARRLNAEDGGHTLTPTALVHEAYLQLVEQDRTEWQSRAHFFAVAAMAMRRILVTHARSRARHKRGAGVVPMDLDTAERMGVTAMIADEQSDQLIALDSALTDLKAFNESGASVVEYRFFGGLQFKEIAEVLGVSEITARRRWTVARAWLRREMVR